MGVGVVLAGGDGRGSVGASLRPQLPSHHLLQHDPRGFLRHVQRLEEELAADLWRGGAVR